MNPSTIVCEPYSAGRHEPLLYANHTVLADMNPATIVCEPHHAVCTDILKV